MKSLYDVVIIGSGFGGAINACRCAQAGRSVCILERGRRWKKTEFPRTTSQVAHAFWNFKAGLTLRFFTALRRAEDEALRAIVARHDERIRHFEQILLRQLEKSVAEHSDGTIELKCSVLSALEYCS